MRRLEEPHLESEDASNSEASRPIVCTGQFSAPFRAELSPDESRPTRTVFVPIPLKALCAELSHVESRPERSALAPISPNATVPTSDGKQQVPRGSQLRRDPTLSEFRYKRVTESQECYSDPNPSPRPQPRPHASPSA